MEQSFPKRKYTYISFNQRDKTQNELRKMCYMHSYIMTRYKEYKATCKADCSCCNRDNIANLFLLLVKRNYLHYKELLKHNKNLNIEKALLNSELSFTCNLFKRINYLTFVLLCMFE